MQPRIHRMGGYNFTMPLDSIPINSTRRVVHAACPHDCPDTCAMLITVENGKAIEIRGDPAHPPTAGKLCTKVARYLDRTYSPDRVLHPMRRIGRKGEGRFARIGWDQALDEIAERFTAIAGSHDGAQAIVPYSYCGTMGLIQGASMDRRFFHRLGASLLDRTICATAGKAGWVSVIGGSVGMDLEQFENSRLILIWGSNPITSNLHLWTRVQEAKRRGARLVAIDPYRSATAEKCHEHIAILRAVHCCPRRVPFRSTMSHWSAPTSCAVRRGGSTCRRSAMRCWTRTIRRSARSLSTTRIRSPSRPTPRK